MKVPVLYVIAYLDQEDLDLVLRPAQPPGKEGHAKPTEAAGNILVAPEAELLMVWVGRPSIHGPLIHRLSDVGEAGIHQLGLTPDRAPGAAAERLGGLNNVI